MMIGILSSIAIPQFMTAADKAKQKEATGIVSDLVKSSFRKILKNSIQKKPEIEVHLIRS